MYVEDDGPSTKKLYIHVAAEHEGTYTCTGIVEGNQQSRTVRLDLFSQFTFYCPKSHRSRLQTDYIQFAYETVRLHLDSLPTVHFAYGHHKNTYPAIHTAAISTMITQFLLYIAQVHKLREIQ